MSKRNIKKLKQSKASPHNSRREKPQEANIGRRKGEPRAKRTLADRQPWNRVTNSAETPKAKEMKREESLAEEVRRQEGN